MHLGGCDAKDLPRASRSRQTASSDRGHTASPVCVPSSRCSRISAVIPDRSPVFNRFVRKELRHQIQLPEAPPYPIENHGDRRRFHAHEVFASQGLGHLAMPLDPYATSGISP